MKKCEDCGKIKGCKLKIHGIKQVFVCDECQKKHIEQVGNELRDFMKIMHTK